jgi:2-polyprenyl-6-methoxyphenol hydroxylase-like FAD-dependent oxidoreductase
VEGPGRERKRYDVVVVGARCAGASTALLLARRGLRVLVIEQDRRGTDTLSTHALMRGAVLQLSRWGVLPALLEAGTPPLRRTRFHYGNHVVDVPIKPRSGVDALFAPRRFVLDAILADAAEAAGADVRYETRVVELNRDRHGRVRGVVIQVGRHPRVFVEADLVIGADGAHSTVARQVGAQVYRTATHRGGVVYGYWSGLPGGSNEWYFGRGKAAGSISTNGGLACVFVSTPADVFDSEIRRDVAEGHRRILADCAPDLLDALGAGELRSPLRGFAGRAGYLRQSWGAGWALVGDAGYFKDPITAHGITDALRDAELLARTVAERGEAGLPGYQHERDGLALPLFEITDEIASYTWNLERAQELHLALSREMNREFAAMVEWHSGASAEPEMKRTA